MSDSQISVATRWLETVRQRHLAAVSILVTSILGLLTVAWTGKEPHVWQLSLLFASTLILVFVFCVLNYRTVLIAVRTGHSARLQASRYSRLLKQNALEEAAYRTHIQKSDAAFRDLAMRRTEFDNDIFEHAYAKSLSKRQERMAKDLEGYLTAVCDAAVDIFSGRKQTARDVFQSNIKVIRKVNDSYIYNTSARSSNTPDIRMERDDINYAVHSNYVFDQAIDDLRRIHVVQSTSRTIELYSRIGKAFTAPTPRAGEFYNSSLTILLFIKPRKALLLEDADDDENTYYNGQGDRVYGFMSIDSKSYQFYHNNEEDIGIIEELSIQALSALRFYARLCKIVIKDN